MKKHNANNQFSLDKKGKYYTFIPWPRSIKAWSMARDPKIFFYGNGWLLPQIILAIQKIESHRQLFHSCVSWWGKGLSPSCERLLCVIHKAYMTICIWDKSRKLSARLPCVVLQRCKCWTSTVVVRERHLGPRRAQQRRCQLVPRRAHNRRQSRENSV